MEKNLILCFILLVLCCSCIQGNSEQDFFNAAFGKDFKVPVLEKVETIDDYDVCLTFSEEVIPFEECFENCTVEADGCNIIIHLSSLLKPGKSYTVSGRVSDLSGNSCSVSVKVWGFNKNPAQLVINEFTTKGTNASPDRTELYVIKGGSLSGICLFDGIPSDYRSYVMFDNDDYVDSGSYIVIWWTDKLPTGVSSHPEEGIYNIAAKTGTNLSENNGILTLSLSPSEGATVIDCVSYSSQESSEYGGFGTKEVYQRVISAKDKGFLIQETVSSKNSTATRSISKKADNSWYITVTSGSTFGQANTSARYSD